MANKNIDNAVLRRISIKYFVIGAVLIFLSWTIEPLLNFNPIFVDERSLSELLLLFGIITVCGPIPFYLIGKSADHKPTEKEVENFEATELRNQFLVTLGILILFICCTINAFRTIEDAFHSWIVWIGYGGLFLAGIVSVQSMRGLFFSKMDGRLGDERLDMIFSKAHSKAFFWVFQFTLVGYLASGTFGLDIPVWYAFIGTGIFAHLVLHGSVLKQMWDTAPADE